jgi:hypothetical protein
MLFFLTRRGAVSLMTKFGSQHMEGKRGIVF